MASPLPQTRLITPTLLDCWFPGALACSAGCFARFSGWSSGSLVDDQPLVGGFGLFGQSAFGLADCVVGARDAADGRGVFRGAGGELEAAEFFLVSDGCWWAWSSPRVGMHQNRIASLRAVATIAWPCPRRVRVRL
jgi:hypothetical protein